jgi:hypothetical protein
VLGITEAALPPDRMVSRATLLFVLVGCVGMLAVFGLVQFFANIKRIKASCGAKFRDYVMVQRLTYDETFSRTF